ncbi:MAG: type II secretion system F family protein [Acidaminococcaceae bacterium]|nr:type II secretion system F family protein [Acidaminococcaceae bacterium]
MKDKQPFHRWFKPRLQFTNKERANFYKQLSTLLDAGIPIVKAIEMVTGRLSEKHKPVCMRLNLSLQSGHPLSYAMSLQPEIFSEMNISVVEAGEVSGQISRVLLSLSEFYKLQDKLAKLVRNACIYPGFLLGLALLTFLFFSVKLVPSFAEMYRSLGVKETPLLQILLSVSILLQKHIIALSCACLAGGKLLLRQREEILFVLMRFPGIRLMRHSFLEIRFTRLLALMLFSGIAFPEAILRASVTLTDTSMKNNAKKFSENVLRGVGITEAAMQSGNLFSQMGLEFLSIGESSGNLPDMLTEFAEIQEQELFARLRDLKSVLEPALVVVIATMVFAVMAVMLSPLFDLMTRMPEYE